MLNRIEIKAFDGRITGLVYTSAAISLNIQVKSFVVVVWNRPENIGHIFEKYRKIENEKTAAEATEFWDGNLPIINNFIAKVENPFPDYDLDSFICFYPVDTNRRDTLLNFAANLLKEKTNYQLLDISTHFYKKDPRRSIIVDSAKENFQLTLTRQLKKLLIIDDTVNEGRTISALLTHLEDAKLIDANTEIKVICIYNLRKNSTIPLNFLKT